MHLKSVRLIIILIQRQLTEYIYKTLKMDNDTNNCNSQTSIIKHK